MWEGGGVERAAAARRHPQPSSKPAPVKPSQPRPHLQYLSVNLHLAHAEACPDRPLRVRQVAPHRAGAPPGRGCGAGRDGAGRGGAGAARARRGERGRTRWVVAATARFWPLLYHPKRCRGTPRGGVHEGRPLGRRPQQHLPRARGQWRRGRRARERKAPCPRLHGAPSVRERPPPLRFHPPGAAAAARGCASPRAAPRGPRRRRAAPSRDTPAGVRGARGCEYSAGPGCGSARAQW
jgi:hypothetical protein